jgi:N-methylhydantoinase B/oxoprolinase/acetone carboxylase alpha subunit
MPRNVFSKVAKASWLATGGKARPASPLSVEPAGNGVKNAGERLANITPGGGAFGMPRQRPLFFSRLAGRAGSKILTSARR